MVVDPEDNTDRTPKPLSAAAAKAIADGRNRQQQGGLGQSTLMGSQMGSQMMSGVGMSSALPSAAMSATDLESVSSQFKAYGSENQASGSVHSQVSGSLMSSMNGSILSQMSDGSQLSDSQSGVSSLKKAQETAKAAEVMKNQLIAEAASLSVEQLDAPTHLVFRESECFMLLDIKSALVRKDDTEGITTTEASNQTYESLKELKITAADNYAVRGVNTSNLIQKSKQVQESAPPSLENTFQATEWDIYDQFFDDAEGDEGGGEDEAVKIDEKDLGGADGVSNAG